jgi:hypothetical protein
MKYTQRDKTSNWVPYPQYKGQRYKRRYYQWVELMMPEKRYAEGYSWSTSKKAWVANGTPWEVGEFRVTCAPCHSLKAFKRHIKKHKHEVPNGWRFVLCGRYGLEIEHVVNKGAK